MLDTRGVPLPVLQPMLATTGDPRHDQDCFSYEVKWDGWRSLVYIEHGLRVRTRTGRQVADSLPELTGLVNALGGHRVIVDGELVACPGGKVDFYALAPRMMPPGAWRTGPPARSPLPSWPSTSCTSTAKI
jgi:bifunctional non-homologous end joining protein LigD